MICLRRS